MDNGAENYRLYCGGDENAFTEIVKEYKDSLILYLCGFTGNIYDAEELAEDTFVKLGIRKPVNLRKASFKTWLYTIARNTAIDFLRKKRRRRETSFDECSAFLSEEEAVEEYFEIDERKTMLHKALLRMKNEYRQVLWLIYFEGFSNKETAKIMEKSEHNIETLAYRARLSLKSELLKDGFIYENL